MNPPSLLRAILLDPRTRTGLAAVTALVWFLLGVSLQEGRNAAPTVIVGIPAMLVLFWWRRHPLRSVGLSAAALLLTAVTSWLGTAGGGVIVVLGTVWFAVLGASADSDRRVRWAGSALAAVYSLVALLWLFGYGASTAFLFIAFMLALAIGLGWAWRQFRHTVRLEGVVQESRQRVDLAERDARIEVERNRIAREVHDVVAHSLAVVAAQADGARYAAESNPASVGPALESIADTARRALGEVRTMLHDLKASGPGAVPPGADDIAALVEGIRALDVAVDECSFGEPRPLGADQGLALYRVAQEALTNAMRHGDRAEPIGFELDWGAREVVLVVTNAVPADEPETTERQGHGIIGMRERAADAGGDCTAGIGTNGRFRVRVALPLLDDEPAAEAEEAPPNPLVALIRGEPEPRRA